MELQNLFGGRLPSHPVTGYRFADFTIYELAQLKIALRHNLACISQAIDAEPMKLHKQLLAEEGEVSARLYDEVIAAIHWLGTREERPKRWWR